MIGPSGALSGPKGSIQTGHSSGGAASLRKASGLFITHSRVNNVGTTSATSAFAAALLEAPAIAPCVLVRLVLELFWVMNGPSFIPPEKKTDRRIVV